MPAGRRIFFGVAALVPLLAPYELLFSVRWDTWMHPFFFLAALVSVGALAITGLLLFAAVAGLESQMILDQAQNRFTYSERAPILPTRVHQLPLEAVRAVTVETHNWSDGPPSYSLKISAAGGRSFATASSDSREEIENLRERAIRLLGEERRCLDA